MQGPGVRGRAAAACATVLLLVACGCYRQRVVIQVSPDGSAHVGIVRVLSSAGGNLMGGYGHYILGGAMGDAILGAGGATNIARRLGAGDAPVSVECTSGPGGVSFVAVFRVPDVNALNLPLSVLFPTPREVNEEQRQEMDPFAAASRRGRDEAEEAEGIRFGWTGQVLRVVFPELPPAPALPAGAPETLDMDEGPLQYMRMAGGGDGEGDAAKPDPAATLRGALAGLETAMDVELIDAEGRPVVSRTILSFRADAMLAHPHGPSALLADSRGSERTTAAGLYASLGAWGRYPGVQVPSNGVAVVAMPPAGAAKAGKGVAP